MHPGCFQWFKDTNLKANHNHHLIFSPLPIGCFQWFKDTNLKANHNMLKSVLNDAKGCFQWFKDTNLKANHNDSLDFVHKFNVVFNGSKILI